MFIVTSPAARLGRLPDFLWTLYGLLIGAAVTVVSAMFTVLSFPPSSDSSRQVADLITEYAAFDRLRRWRRDLLKSGGTMSVIAVIAAALKRMSVPECGAALALFLIPPAAVWLFECLRWRGLWRRLNQVPVGLIRKS